MLFLRVIPGQSAGLIPESRDSGSGPSDHPGMTRTQSAHAEKIALADFHAVVPQQAMGGHGVEVEIREGEAVEELLPRKGQAVVGADREGDVARIGAFELRRL